MFTGTALGWVGNGQFTVVGIDANGQRTNRPTATGAGKTTNFPTRDAAGPVWATGSVYPAPWTVSFGVTGGPSVTPAAATLTLVPGPVATPAVTVTGDPNPVAGDAVIDLAGTTVTPTSDDPRRPVLGTLVLPASGTASGPVVLKSAGGRAVDVFAVDAFNNPVGAAFSGPAAVTVPGDPQAVVPPTVTLTDGAATFAVTLQALGR